MNTGSDISHELNHFLALARRGKHGAASGGAIRARLLAENIAENVPGLDGTARQGLVEFIDLASAQPTTARDLLNGV